MTQLNQVNDIKTDLQLSLKSFIGLTVVLYLFSVAGLCADSSLLLSSPFSEQTHTHTLASETLVLPHFSFVSMISVNINIQATCISVVITTLNSTELEERRYGQSTARTPALGLQKNLRMCGH